MIRREEEQRETNNDDDDDDDDEDGDDHFIPQVTQRSIVGFHMTSLKFKLQNYRSYWDFTFMVY